MRVPKSGYKYNDWFKTKREATARANRVKKLHDIPVRLRKAAGGWGVYYKGGTR